MGSIQEKNRGRKSRDTAPLSSLGELIPPNPLNCLIF